MPTGQEGPGRARGRIDPRRARFVAAYLSLADGAKAVVAAGFSPKSAAVMAVRLLRDPAIAKLIAEGQAAVIAQGKITQERVLDELALLAFSSVDNYTVDDDGRVAVRDGRKPECIRAISSIKHRVTTDAEGVVTRTTELRLWDKPGPIKLAGRHVGLFDDRAMTKDQLEAAVDARIEELREEAREARKQRAIDVGATTRTD